MIRLEQPEMNNNRFHKISFDNSSSNNISDINQTSDFVLQQTPADSLFKNYEIDRHSKLNGF